MIHGDYHIKNIMMQNGEVLLIDMDTLSYGHPVFELASMYLAYEGYGMCDSTVIEKFLGVPYDTAVSFWNKSIALYFDNDSAIIKDAESKAKLIGYTRMMRRTIRRFGDTPEGKELVSECKKQLIELIRTTQTLDF